MNTLKALSTLFALLLFSLVLHPAASHAAEPMIAAGNSFSLALKEDGTVWAWGKSSGGQRGDGSRDWGIQWVKGVAK